MNLSSNCKFTKVQDHTTAGTGAVNSDSVDMSGYEGVLFITSFGTAATDNTIEGAQSANDSNWNDLIGSQVVPGASDEDVWLDIYKPIDRYMRCEIARGTSTTCESIWAIQYGARKGAVDNTTTGTIAGEQHSGLAEGAA